MNNPDIVSQLIRGSDNINRMREEIHKTASGLLSICQTIFVQGRHSFEIDAKCGVWEVEVDHAFNRNNSIGYKMTTPLMGVVYESNKRDASEKIAFWSVQAIHDDLTALVNGMLKAYPGLGERINPILLAANKQL